MKTLLVISLLLSAGIAHGQAASTPPEQKKENPIKHLLPAQQEVLNGEEKYFRLLEVKDLKNYMSLWDDGFIGWPDYMESPVRKPAIEASVAEEFRSPQQPSLGTLLPTPEDVGIFGNFAITTYFWPENDTSSPFKYRILHAWQKGSQGWHIVGGMSCEVPRSNPVAGSQTPSAQVSDESAVEATVRGYEGAVQRFDYDKADSFLAPNAKWIERSAPEPAVFNGVATGFWGEAKATKVRLTNEPHDFEIHILGDAAWVTLFVDVATIADNEAARRLLDRTETEETGRAGNPTQREWRATYTESEVLVRTPKGWRIALAHTSRLPEKPK